MKYMAEVGIRALKQNASAVVARVVAGEEVTVTDRGRPVVQVVPIQSSPVARMVASGTARPPRHALRELSEPSVTGELSAIIMAMRADERH